MPEAERIAKDPSEKGGNKKGGRHINGKYPLM